MAYSFVKIEREKSRIIGFLLVLLLVVYFFTAWALWASIQNYFAYKINHSSYEAESFIFYWPSLSANLVIFLFCFIAVGIQFLTSISNLSTRIIGFFGAEALNKNYPPHNMLNNIVEEVGVALGGVRINCCVVNSAGLNAFSVSDYSGNSYIGVTEGLLTRLNRQQLESVVGHEAAHIASGDSLLISVAYSLFGVYEAIFNSMASKERGMRFTSNRSFFPVIIFVIVGITRFFNQIICTFISQQKEFRADAVAVRLTRNPLALAQSLYIISRSSWHSQFNGENSLSSLCIIEPEQVRSEGQSSVFSTHPPIKERIAILLNMAHTDQKTLEELCKNVRPALKIMRKNNKIGKKKKKEIENNNSWFVLDKDRWQGPFLFGELLNNKWITSTHLVRREGAIISVKAFEDNDLKSLFETEKSKYEYSCPECCHGLETIDYEGVKVFRCISCKGILADWRDIQKILTRESMGFTQEIITRANQIKSEKNKRFGKIKKINTPFVLSCPKCKKKMRRKLFSHYASVEIDQCVWCAAVWFESDELEIIQTIYDQIPQKEILID